MKCKITLFFILIFGNSIAQNLVLNPSFEEIKYCPHSIGQFNRNVKHWSTPNSGTTDYFNTCNSELGSTNYNGDQQPEEGKGYVGFYTLAPQNYKEYLQGELQSQLKTDEEYIISFFISLADKSINAINQIGVLFIEKPLQSLSYNVITNKNLVNETSKFEFVQQKKDSFYLNTKDWVKIELTYKAKGFENFFIIGSFDSNRKIEKRKYRVLTHKKHLISSYYYLDNVSIAPKKRKDVEKEKNAEKVVFEIEKILLFKSVLFDFDTAKLLNTAIEELDKLYFYLLQRQDLNIEIYGHTDNVGLKKRNESLSKERAKAVSEYLILKGLDKNRIQWFGFGSSKPKFENISGKNRAQNRRVEFKLVNK